RDHRVVGQRADAVAGPRRGGGGGGRGRVDAREDGLAHAEAGQERHDREQAELDDETVTPGGKHVRRTAGSYVRCGSARNGFSAIFPPCDDPTRAYNLRMRCAVWMLVVLSATIAAAAPVEVSVEGVALDADTGTPVVRLVERL